jgi:poly(A) polymerase
MAGDVAVRLKLSNKARKRLACAAADQADSTPEVLAYRRGTECAVDRLLLAGNAGEAARIAEWHPPRLPISGGALIARGLAEGPIVARTLRGIEQRWLDAGFPSGVEFDAIVADALADAQS